MATRRGRSSSELFDALRMGYWYLLAPSVSLIDQLMLLQHMVYHLDLLPVAVYAAVIAAWRPLGSFLTTCQGPTVT